MFSLLFNHFVLFVESPDSFNPQQILARRSSIDPEYANVLEQWIGHRIWGKSKMNKDIAFLLFIFRIACYLFGIRVCAVVPIWVKSSAPRRLSKLICWNMSMHLIISRARIRFWAQISFSPYQHKNLMPKRQWVPGMSRLYMFCLFFVGYFPTVISF